MYPRNRYRIVPLGSRELEFLNPSGYDFSVLVGRMADSSAEKRASRRGMGRGHREGNSPLLDDGGISLSEGGHE